MTEQLLTAAADAAPVTASASTRTITGRIVPFGPAGQTSQGRLTFAAGALRWTDPKRVKLLLEHDQRQAVGYATELEERADGIYGTFSVPAHPLGDTALLEASHGLRDAFSVGVQLDDAAAEKLRRAQGTPSPGTGALREVSLVSVPAFDDARVDSVAATTGALVVSAWSTSSDHSTEAPSPVSVPVAVPSVTEPVFPVAVPPERVPAVPVVPEPVAPAPAEPSREDSPMPDTVEPAAPTAPVIPTQPGPEVIQAAAGAALITGEPATYTFSGNGPSLARDAMYAKEDPDAAARLVRFNTQLASGDTAQTMALAAVATRTDLNELVNPSVRRPDLLLSAIDLGRPVWASLNPIRLANAQPFLIPVEGDFTGVGPHTEGTAHVPEGTMTFDEVTVTPRAVSGAFRLSRELVDSASPAADQLVVRAMLRNYARVSEALAVAGLVAGAGAAVLAVDTVGEVSAQLNDFAVTNGYPPAAIIAGTGFFGTIRAQVDSTGRQMLPNVGPQNAAGTAGLGSATIDGVPMTVSRDVAAAEAFILGEDGVIVGESPVQTFRFDQPEGPGVIKIALFAYQVAAVTRTGAVRRLTTATV